MTFDIVRKFFSDYLRASRIKIDITGFDMEGFTSAMDSELRRRLDMIEYIAFSDDTTVSDAKKVASIKALFQREFYSEE